MMNNMSMQFNMDDIRRIRDANSERHLKMTPMEIINETKQKSESVLKKLEELKKQKSSII